MKSRVLGLRVGMVLLSGLAMSVVAQAQPSPPQLSTADYPSAKRPVKIVVPSAAGSSADAMARIVANGLAERWNSPAIVENRPGAGGIVGATSVARSSPDGYTLLFAFTSVAVSPTLAEKPPYTIENDFLSVSMVAYGPIVLAIREDSAVRSLREFLTVAKNQVAPLTYGTNGPGTIYHIYGETLKRAASVDLSMIPYRGEGPAFTDLIGGNIDATFVSVGLVRPQINAGTARALAIAMPTRSKLLPDVPTFGEQGFPQLDVAGWMGLFLPLGTPAAIVRKVSEDVDRILGDPEVARAMLDLGLEPARMTSDQFAAFIREDGRKWKSLTENAAMKPK
jgi:tripartite-type tricarboxylate transporter receptor subunit TctC